MDISKILMASFLASLILLHFAVADKKVNEHMAQNSLANKIDCGEACATRCRLSSRPHLCNRACGTCCARCSCVPPGTAGNQGVCPCYANMTTHGGRSKCP